MKSQEKLNALKEEVNALNINLQKLTDEELEKVTGGTSCLVCNSVAENCAKGDSGREWESQTDVGAKEPDP